MVSALILKSLLLGSIVSSVYAQPSDVSAPPQAMQRICSQCHALEIMGKCLAGDCAAPQVVRVAEPRSWGRVLDRMKGRGAIFNERERQEILTHLQASYPPKRDPLTWNKVGDFAPRGGWNINNLMGDANFLYAGFEGDGKIFRTPDGINWQEVADTRHDMVFHITSFKGALYAGIAEPDPQIWRSIDGLHWQEYARLPADDIGVYSLGIFKNHLYAGTGKGFIYRSDNGKKWAQVAALQGDVSQVMSRWPRFFIPFKGYLYTGFEQGPLYRSANGSAWTQSNLKIGDDGGTRCATVFKGELYVGTMGDGTIWKTKDGQVWQQAFKSSNGLAHVDSMAVAGKYLFASLGGYVFRSLDGLAWEEVGKLTPYVIEAMTAWRGKIYAGTLTQPVAFLYQADSAP